MAAPPTQHPLIQNTLLAVAYLVMGKLGLLLAIPPGYATAIFPPAGIALAAMLLYGGRVWPGIWLGSTAMNVWISLDAGAPLDFGTLAIALCIGAGATLQALVGNGLIRRYVGFPNPLDNERTVLAFLLLGGPISCLVNSLIGPGTLWAANVISGAEFLYSAWTWWVGDSIGVMVATPLVLILLARPGDAWAARRRSVAVPLLFTMMIVVAVFVRASDWETNRLQERFNESVENFTNQLNNKLTRHLTMLQSLERFFASTAHVTRDEFKTFVEPNLQSLAGLHAITWTPRVLGDDRARFEAETRQLFPSFQIFQRNLQGMRIRAPQQSEYYPVFYIEPRLGNHTALGFDTASNPLALAAQQQARDSGVASASAPLKLIQEYADQQGVVIYHPIYDQGVDLTDVTARRTHLRGYVSLVFRLDDLINQVLNGLPSKQLNLQIDDVTAGGNPIRLFSKGSIEAAPGTLQWAKPIKVAGRQWQVIGSSHTTYTTEQAWLAWFVLAVGLLFTALLGAFLLVVTGHTAKIEHLVAVRTDDLARASHEASASNKLLATISKTQSAFISASDTREMYDTLLSDLLALTDSAYGFIGEILYTDQGQPYLKTRAISNIAWNEETRNFYDENAPQGLEFTNLDNLFGHVITSGEPVIANLPVLDPRSGGLPDGHPSLDAFLGLPFSKGNQMVGMVGIANRPAGYDTDLIEYLQPLLKTLANLFVAQRLDQQRTMADQALRESESRLRAIFEHAIEAIVTFDARGAIRSINPAGERLFGYSAFELLDKSWHQLLPKELQQDFKSAFARYLESGNNELIGSTREVEGQHRDGTRIPIEMAISAVHNESGLLFTAIVHDLTERRRVDRMKNEFISTISHELRTPLTSILGNLGLINGGAVGSVPVAMAPLVESAHRNSKRLLNLINDILDIEKIETGHLSMRLQAQPLLPLVIQAIDNNRGFAENFSVSLSLVQPPATECWARVDADRFIQVLNNLISNAIKFSPENAEVELHLCCQDQQAVLRVRDHGPGIPPQFQSQIFQKFAQADASDTRQHAGTGLGLHISRALVMKMQGLISFSCPEDGGTEFRVSLPVHQASGIGQARRA